MSIASTAVRSRTLTVRLDIENAEDRVLMFSGRTYAPSRATVHYSAFTAPGGKVSGYIRRKDGTLGRVLVTEHWRYEEAPEWLKAAVDAERPEWAAR